jgi:hypothetical protein
MRLTEEQIIEQIKESHKIYLEDEKYYEESTEKIPIPNFCYKYRNWCLEGKEFDDAVLTNQILHFSNPNCFSDKKDCRNLVDYTILNEDLILRDKFKIHLAVTHFLKTDLPLLVNDIKAYCNSFGREDFSQNVIEEHNNNEWLDYCEMMGILSLSKTYKSNKMWEDYSTNYTGVCYAFDTVTLLNDLRKQEKINGSYVKYENELPLLSILSSNWEKTEIRKYIKLREEYVFENEFRLCLNKRD